MASKKMTQQEIDALLKESMFSDDDLKQSKPPKEQQSNQYGEQFESYQQSMAAQSRPHIPAAKRQPEEESYQYGSQQFESYEESRNTFKKSAVKTDPKFGKVPANSKKLSDIKQQASPQVRSKEKKVDGSKEKPRPKTGIYFYPPKQQQSYVPPSGDRKYLPHNYARLEQRERQLLLTTLTEENRHLKEDLRLKEQKYQKLDRNYKALLQEKAHHAPSVRQATLEKQLAALQTRHQKLQNLCKLERQKNVFKTAKSSQGFVASQQASQREQQLLQIIDKLKDRLMSTDSQLRVLQKKMSEGQDYIDELKRKMKRVEQLEFKMQKMTDQAQCDRQYIQHLKNSNATLQGQIFELQKQKRLMEIEIRRYELGQATQSDTMAELQEVKKEKEKLQSNLRELTMNMTNMNKSKSRANWVAIEDSGQLLKP